MICPRCHGTGLVPCAIHNWEWPDSCDSTDECIWCDGAGFEEEYAFQLFEEGRR